MILGSLCWNLALCVLYLASIRKFGRWSDEHVGTVLLRSGDGYRREEPGLESERSVALQVDSLYIPRLEDVRRCE